MLMKNTSDHPVSLRDLGRKESVAPGAVVEIPDSFALKRPFGHASNRGLQCSIVSDVAPGLVPATPDEQARYDSLSTEDLAPAVQRRQETAAENARMNEAIYGVEGAACVTTPTRLPPSPEFLRAVAESELGARYVPVEEQLARELAALRAQVTKLEAAQAAPPVETKE